MGYNLIIYQSNSIMVKQILILTGLFFTITCNSQTGIGTTAPVNKLQVETTTADPATSGTSANGNFRLSGTTGSHVLDFGLSSSSTYSWLQTRSKSAYGTNYNLILNPNGGNVGIGTSAPISTLTIGNTTGTIPGEITLNPSFTSNECGQLIFKKSLNGSTQDWIIDQFGTTAGDARLRILSGQSGVNGLNILENGFVGLGTTTPVDRLDIRNAMSVNEIKFRGIDGGDDSDPYRLRKFKIGNSNELQLHLNDDSDERFAIYGNSCLTTGCPEYSPHLYHYFRSDGDVYHAGRVGIGTTSPAAALHVASSVGQSVGSYGFLNTAGAGSGNFSGTISYSIQADQRIRAAEFKAVSDARIKKDIKNLNTTKQLSDINKLKVVNYSYIDQLVNGNQSKTGFIAQEVEKVNTQFVNQSADFIPSVFAIAKATRSDQTGLHITTTAAHGFAKGDEVKFFAEGKKEVIKTIDVVFSPDSFSIKEWNEPTDNLFVYGKKVADFRAIDFDQITALSVAAIQELSKQIEKLQLENTALNKLINNKIQAKQSELEKRLLQLESKHNKKKR